MGSHVSMGPHVRKGVEKHDIYIKIKSYKLKPFRKVGRLTCRKKDKRIGGMNVERKTKKLEE